MNSRRLPEPRPPQQQRRPARSQSILLFDAPIPSNNVFLRNKGSGHRGSRNDLIELVDTPEKEIVPMHERARQQATRKSFSPTASPGTVEVADIVQERLAKGDQVLVSVCEDMHPACSQEALGYCMTKVRRERSRGN